MNWAHIEKAPKQIYQEVIRLKSTGPKYIRVTTTQLEKTRFEELESIWKTWNVAKTTAQKVRWRASVVALWSTRYDEDLVRK